MKLLGLITLFGVISFTQAQTITISGKLEDHQTQEVLPFAHVYIKGTSRGTLSNIDGYFSINLAEKYQEDSIIFSSIGYESKLMKVEDLAQNQNVTMQLTPSETVLDEVVISTLSAADIWKNAVKNRNKNFVSSNYKLTGFYRTTYQEDGYFSRLLEAAVNIHGKGSLKKKADIEYLEIRKSADLRKNVWKIYDGYLEHLVNNHPLRWMPDFLSPRGMSRYSFQIEDVLVQDNNLFYRIKATSPVGGMQDVELLIEENDYRIHKISIFWKPENASNFSWAWERKDGSEFYCDWQTSVYEYTSFEGKMFPKRSSWHRTGRVIDSETKETLFKTESIDELLVTNMQFGNDSFKNKAPIEVQNIYEMAEYFPYQAAFWQTFDRPVDSEYFKRAKSKMEAHQPLEEQFQENSGLKAIN